MPSSIEQIYKEIKRKLTVDHLKKITVDIINSYKNRNFKYLRKFISLLKIDPNTKNEKLFSLLIMKYHPDRLSYILKQLEELYGERDYEKLSLIHNSYFFRIDAIKSDPDINIQFEAEYRFDKNDFGYRETNIFEKDDFGETNLDFGEEEENSFYEALNRYYFGGLDHYITEFDLKNLDGELDLSDYEIQDLNGIENCIYLNELNLSNNTIEKIGRLSFLIHLQALFLSNNAIENIDALEHLANLKVLDISFNNISNIEILESLGKLEYLNIIGNPINDYSVVNRLIAKGVIVIFEENIVQ